VFDLLGRLFNQLLIAGCCLSLILVLVSLAGLIRLLPALLPFARLGLRVFLVLSYRAYALILSRLAPDAKRGLGIDILSGFPRVVATGLLSLVVGLVFLALTRSPVTIWNAGLFLLHGLVVGWVWNGIEEPDDLLLGVKLR